MRRIYLDYSATTPVGPEVLSAMQKSFRETFGNASSVHHFGRTARAVLEESRERIAGTIGARPEEIVFTSGGTESDNTALKGAAWAGRGAGKNHIIVSAVEHHAVLHTARALEKEGWKLDVIEVDRNGVVDLDRLSRCVTVSTALVSVMHANNETGTIEPVRQAAEIAHRAGAIFHCDAVQSYGKIQVPVRDLGADLLSLSAHKIYGPKGIGALFVRRGTRLDPLLEGGGQEQNRRAGTENVPLAVGFAKAAEIAGSLRETEFNRVRELRSFLEKKLRSEFDGMIFNGHPTDCLPHILSVSFDSSAQQVDGEALIMGMDLRGVAVTSGSACTSGTLEPSHVLRAMGRDENTARATIRFSLGRQTTADEIDHVVDALQDVIKTMRAAVHR